MCWKSLVKSHFSCICNFVYSQGLYLGSVIRGNVCDVITLWSWFFDVADVLNGGGHCSVVKLFSTCIVLGVLNLIAGKSCSFALF